MNAKDKSILRLMVHGYSDEGIAKKLHLYVNHVKDRVEYIIEELNATNRIHAVAIAVDYQLTDVLIGLGAVSSEAESALDPQQFTMSQKELEKSRWGQYLHKLVEERLQDVLDAISTPELSKLTEREREIFEAFTNPNTVGLSNRKLAEELNMGEGTVKKHLRNIYWKLGCNNKTELAFAASQVRKERGNEASTFV